MKHFKVAAAGIAAFVSLVYYMCVTAKPDEDLLTARCRYDTKELCPECFPRPSSWVYCRIFEDDIYYTEGVLTRETFEEFDQHSIRHDIVFGRDPNIVINNLNRKKSIENIRDKICAELGISVRDCHMGNNRNFTVKLRKAVADDLRLPGAIMCPRRDERAVERFVRKFKQPELLTLLLMATNSQSLMVLLGSVQNLPVPSLVFQEGFTLIESYEGPSLTNFYYSPIQLKLKIAYELINAVFKLNAGVYEFRILLRSVNPEDIMVNVLPNATVKITFAALDNVVIFNDVNGTVTRIKCDQYYGEACYCSHIWGSHMNLVHLCRLFLENHLRERDEGFLRFLHPSDTVKEYGYIREMLQRCLDCIHPNCDNLQLVFTNIQEEIMKLLISH